MLTSNESGLRTSKIAARSSDHQPPLPGVADSHSTWSSCAESLTRVVQPRDLTIGQECVENCLQQKSVHDAWKA